MGTFKTHIIYKGQAIPIKVYAERRNNARYSIGKKTAIARFPIGMPKKEIDRLFAEFQKWVILQFDNTPELRQRFFGKTYKDGDELAIMDKVFGINIRFADRKSHHAIIKGDTIHLTLSQYQEPAFLQKPIKTLLSRTLADYFLPELEKRVDFYNDKYFKESINFVRMKLNQSNWGSCSSNRNLNFSTRLLFAPSEVIDYVIVHELAHLKEMNHSDRFWNIVQKVMPDYKEKELWLKKNGHLCSF